MITKAEDLAWHTQGDCRHLSLPNGKIVATVCWLYTRSCAYATLFGDDVGEYLSLQNATDAIDARLAGKEITG